MKRIFCLIMVLIFCFLFSACGGNTEEETTTSAPAPDLSIEQIADALSTGNGAVIDKLEGERYSYFAYVYEVDSRSSIDCYMHHLNNSAYDYDYGIKINSIGLSLSNEYDEQQEKMILDLREDDKIYFEGMLTEIYFYNGMVNLLFDDVRLTEQNQATQ